MGHRSGQIDRHNIGRSCFLLCIGKNMGLAIWHQNKITRPKIKRQIAIFKQQSASACQHKVKADPRPFGRNTNAKRPLHFRCEIEIRAQP